MDRDQYVTYIDLYNARLVGEDSGTNEPNCTLELDMVHVVGLLQEYQVQNVAVFATRFCGGAHLGSQGFVAVKDLVKSALEKFKDHQ